MARLLHFVVIIFSVVIPVMHHDSNRGCFNEAAIFVCPPSIQHVAQLFASDASATSRGKPMPILHERQLIQGSDMPYILFRHSPYTWTLAQGPVIFSLPLV